MHPFLIIILFLLTSCCGWHPSPEYCAMYAHLQEIESISVSDTDSDFFLIIYVDAPHLDYTNNTRLIQTIARHPNGSKNRDVGHAWIALHGTINGQIINIEGGHSGELGIAQARYFDGIMNYVDYGDANPTEEIKRHPRKREANPIKYLWTTQHDGYFEKGSGNHIPTFALKCDLTQEQFERIYAFIQPQNYNYCEYSLTDHQCCTFVAQVAALIGLSLDYEITIEIDPILRLGFKTIRLWEDPKYSTFTFGSPDILERSLIECTN